MANIEIDRPPKFCEEFLKHYLGAGLGRMQKRDIDVLVMHLLISDGRYKFPRDTFKAARELSITETKVRNLYQEVQLRYQQLPEEEAKASLVELINKKAFEIKGERIVFIVRDPMLGQWFQEWVADVDGFTDSSFNPNLVTVHKKVLVDVLDKIAVSQIPTLNKDFEQFNKTDGRKSKLRLFVDELIKSAGKEAGKLTTKALAKILAGILGVTF